MSRTNHIERLTPEQVALLPVVRDEWLEHGLSTAPADRARAEAGVAAAYREAGLEPPRFTIWVRSPHEGVYASALLRSEAFWKALGQPTPAAGGFRDQVRDQVGDQVWDQVRDQVWGQVRDQVRDQVWDQVRDQVWDQVRDQVWGQVWDQVWDQVGDQVRGQVWDQVGGQVRDQVRGQVRDQVRDQVWGQVWDQVWDQVGGQVRESFSCAIYGQHEAGWLSFYDLFGRIGLDAPKRLTGLSEVAKSAGWWWPMRGCVLLTERPTLLHRDAQGRLHSEFGPAIQYPDGWGIWAIHGVRVPERVVMTPADLAPAEILGESNAELRRVMMERFGFERLMLESEARELHRDDWGRLLRLDIDGDEPLVMVAVVNSTAEPDGSFKDYLLRVPPTCRTAREAVAWTFDIPAEQYAPLVET